MGATRWLCATLSRGLELALRRPRTMLAEETKESGVFL
jgi:hypothetical protein